MQLAAFAKQAQQGSAKRRPNVLVIITDDQGYGDLSLHGNPVLQTPQLDRLALEGARVEPFYVCPVCAPTRASLMTGRYNYRTGAVDTYLGRAQMFSDEVTLAEVLQSHGYRTGIFGKWHLGDNFPMRPQDQGFEETLVHRGGGIGQPSDPPAGNRYQDPWLEHNGQYVQAQGYCSDVYTDALLQFMEDAGDSPFFAWLAFNCPHGPLEVKRGEEGLFMQPPLLPTMFPIEGWPWHTGFRPDQTAKVYAMVQNIDQNVGRVLARLDELRLAEETLVVFLTDNGPGGVRFNAGLHDRKGSLYEGGLRAPCFMRWPGVIPPETLVPTPQAHIDLFPTILEACDLELPKNLATDGESFWKRCLGKPPATPEEREQAKNRKLFFQWHRGDTPQAGRACAVRAGKYKLVRTESDFQQDPQGDTGWMLFDLSRDPFEQRDLAQQQPKVVAELRAAYEAWFAQMQMSRAFALPRVQIGSDQEPRAILTRQDWRGPKAGWGPGDLGHWEVEVISAGAFQVTLTFPAVTEETTVELHGPALLGSQRVPAGTSQITFENVPFEVGPAELSGHVNRKKETTGAHYLEIARACDL